MAITQPNINIQIYYTNIYTAKITRVLKRALRKVVLPISSLYCVYALQTQYMRLTCSNICTASFVLLMRWCIHIKHNILSLRWSTIQSTFEHANTNTAAANSTAPSALWPAFRRNSHKVPDIVQCVYACVCVCMTNKRSVNCLFLPSTCARATEWMHGQSALKCGSPVIRQGNFKKTEICI